MDGQGGRCPIRHDHDSMAMGMMAMARIPMHRGARIKQQRHSYHHEDHVQFFENFHRQHTFLYFSITYTLFFPLIVAVIGLSTSDAKASSSASAVALDNPVILAYFLAVRYSCVFKYETAIANRSLCVK